MKKEDKPLFTFSILVFICIITIFIILICFFVIYGSFSPNPNEYTKSLINIAMMENDCTTDSECTNGYCYIGKCICDEEWSGEGCQDVCCDKEGFGINGTICIIPTNCTIETILNETIIDVNCTVNEIIIYVNCTINETIVDINCTINEIIIDTNCTVNEIMVDGNCTCFESIENTTCIDDFDCLYNASNPVPSGICYYGKCDCIPGYVGDNCEYELRDGSSCASQLQCFSGVCIFKPPNYGAGECHCPLGLHTNNCIPPI